MKCHNCTLVICPRDCQVPTRDKSKENPEPVGSLPLTAKGYEEGYEDNRIWIKND